MRILFFNVSSWNHLVVDMIIDIIFVTFFIYLLLLLLLMHFAIGNIKGTGKQLLGWDPIRGGKSSLLSLLVHSFDGGWGWLEEDVIEKPCQFLALLTSAFESRCMCHQSLDMRGSLLLKLGSGEVLIQIGQSQHRALLMLFYRGSWRTNLKHFLTLCVLAACEHHDLLAKFLANRVPARSRCDCSRCALILLV